jgi:hypothetical protein
MPKAAKEPKEPKGKAVKEPKAKKAKKEKDPNAPKKPLGAYMWYCKEVREEVKKDFPNLKVTEMGAKLGGMWKALTEDGKKPFYALAEKDKERYAKEKAE